MEYSADLIKRHQLYMLKTHNRVVSDAQAQLDLDAFADLYEVFMDLTKNTKHELE